MLLFHSFVFPLFLLTLRWTEKSSPVSYSPEKRFHHPCSSGFAALLRHFLPLLHQFLRHCSLCEEKRTENARVGGVFSSRYGPRWIRAASCSGAAVILNNPGVSVWSAAICSARRPARVGLVSSQTTCG